MSKATITRNTNETQVQLALTTNGLGKYESQCSCGFLDHMLALFTRHGRFDITLTAKGDTWVDNHHLVEDIGIALGRAFAEALGDMRGITRYGNFLLPMDEALVLVAIDISGRSFLGYDLTFSTEKVGTFDTQLIEEFFLAFTRGLGATLHIKQMAGHNSHHIAEACFKGFGRALAQAVSIDINSTNEIPSTKGTIL